MTTEDERREATDSIATRLIRNQAAEREVVRARHAANKAAHAAAQQETEQ